MNVLDHILALFNRRERKRGFLVLLAAVTVAVVDAFGVASIMPFLAVLGNPGLVETNSWLAEFYRLGGFDSRDSYLFALGLIALAMVLATAFVRAAGQYALLRFANMRRYSLSRRLLDGYLRQPYAFFLSRNSADLTRRTLSDVDTVVDHCLIPVLEMIAHGLAMVMLLLLLVAVHPMLSLIALGTVGGFYTAFYFGAKQSIGRIGRDRGLANLARFTVVAETFGGIKETKLFGREQSFSDSYSGPALRFARHKATADVVALLPRYLIEAVAFGGVLALALVLLWTWQDLGVVLPILGLYAFAGYRMLPSAQKIYNGLTRLRFNFPIVAAILEDMPSVDSSVIHPSAPLLLRHAVHFQNVSYRYPGSARPALSHLNLEILSGQTVGLVGLTGAGKTTAADLLLGLLVPTEGQILIDGVALSDVNRRAWQRNLGYVPQAIFLADASVAENIAFGIPPAEIDRVAVERAAKVANIHEFIVGELMDGYETTIGERGVRLSGGQRQRIGIARALYRDSALLVFDEATNALDNATEAAVMEAIGALRREKTVIIVAHRLTTVRDCDRIVLLDGGKSINIGSFEELSNNSERFRALAKT